MADRGFWPADTGAFFGPHVDSWVPEDHSFFYRPYEAPPVSNELVANLAVVTALTSPVVAVAAVAADLGVQAGLTAALSMPPAELDATLGLALTLGSTVTLSPVEYSAAVSLGTTLTASLTQLSAFAATFGQFVTLAGEVDVVTATDFGSSLSIQSQLVVELQQLVTLGAVFYSDLHLDEVELDTLGVTATPAPSRGVAARTEPETAAGKAGRMRYHPALTRRA